jgi:peptidoglycan/xylan/chitin deacetylase (PgdA/CDA1 family)
VAAELLRRLKWRVRLRNSMLRTRMFVSLRQNLGQTKAKKRTGSGGRVAAAALAIGCVSPAVRAECPDPKTALGVARTIELDAATSGIYGSVTHQGKLPSLLQPKEVVLSFDDGPMPWITHSILDTLDHFCTKAMFFEVGEMAMSHPDVAKEVVRRGHTLGTHTMTHPFNLPRMTEVRATSEIESGFAAVSQAAGGPVAPFFRFPGLADSASLLDYLHGRGIAAFTVDIVSNDSYIADKSRLIQRTLTAVDRQHGGIILFHDIKSVTAKALPEILDRLKAGGYSVVQIKAKDPVHLLPDAVASLAAGQSNPRKHKAPRPFYATVEPDRSARTAALRSYANKKVVKHTEQAADARRTSSVLHRPRRGYLRHSPAHQAKSSD